MSRTRERYHANPHQPRPLVASLLHDACALRLLAQLSQGPATRNALACNTDRRLALRRLMRLELVASYRLRGTFYYRVRHLPPFLQAAVSTYAQGGPLAA